MTEFAIVPGPESEFLELSTTGDKRRFKKHILSEGELLYPGVRGGKITVDQKFLNTVKRNFDNNVCSIVQVPLAGDKNEHTEAPERNIGRVVDLTIEDGKLYAVSDIYKHADDVGKTLLGASAMLSLDYRDTRTGKNAGPTLLHMAVTNRPYVVGLDDFQEVIAASGDSIDEAVILTAQTKEESPMTVDEILNTLKEDHGIDVPELQKTAAEAVELSNQISEIVAGVNDVVTLSNAETAGAEDILTAVRGLADENVALSNKIDEMYQAAQKKDAEARVESLIAEGRILDHARDAQVRLCMENVELFEALLPEKPVVNLSGEEQGQDTVDDAAQEAAVVAEIERLASLQTK